MDDRVFRIQKKMRRELDVCARACLDLLITDSLKRKREKKEQRNDETYHFNVLQRC